MKKFVGKKKFGNMKISPAKIWFLKIDKIPKNLLNHLFRYIQYLGNRKFPKIKNLTKINTNKIYRIYFNNNSKK